MNYLFILLAGLMLSACNTDPKEAPEKETGTGASTVTDTKPEPVPEESKEGAGETASPKPSGGTWSKGDRENFVKGCMTQSEKQLGSHTKAKTYCDCMLGKLQVRYKVADSAARMAITEAVAMAQDCLPK